MANRNDKPRLTPEFQSVLTFLYKHPDVTTWPDHIPLATSNDNILRCTSNVIPTDLSLPLLITDACSNWPATHKWSFKYFKQTYGNDIVLANDRAPARRHDAMPLTTMTTMMPPSSTSKHQQLLPQRTLSTTLSSYITQHIASDNDDTQFSFADYCTRKRGEIDTPFYLNGWRAFSSHPELFTDAPCIPTFASNLDNTLILLEALDRTLFPGQQQQHQQQERQQSWIHNVNTSLSKLFLGPPGTVTRLHYDAGSAHGWLAQIKGRKLFVLYPPSATVYLNPLKTEIETVQSPIDPLHPWNKEEGEEEGERYKKEGKPIAVIVNPGEAVVIPEGWWHYAVSLDESITVQRNFYHANTNAKGLVQMVLKTAAGLKKGGG